MRPAHIVEIVTPKKVSLNGLWFGPKRPKRVVVWVHGLGSSLFGKHDILEGIVDKKTAVLIFNNRGHDKISTYSIGNKRMRGGAVHEVFTDCVDDIQGAINFSKKSGAHSVYLAGHSTGSQKSAYWAAKKGRGVGGIILLAPMSDYAGALKNFGQKNIRHAIRIATTLAHSKHLHEILSEKSWPWPLLADAQRFLSLYSGESEEEIFTYWDTKRIPKTLCSIKLPLLVILAEKDEYADRPAKKIQDWFAAHIKVGDEIAIVKGAPHGFKGAEKRIASGIKKWILGNKSV